MLCPTEGCTVHPPKDFIYCQDHAVSEKPRYDLAARIAELEAVLRDATTFIVHPGLFDGVERLALASRCRLALKGKENDGSE